MTDSITPPPPRPPETWSLWDRPPAEIAAGCRVGDRLRDAAVPPWCRAALDDALAGRGLAAVAIAGARARIILPSGAAARTARRLIAAGEAGVLADLLTDAGSADAAATAAAACAERGQARERGVERARAARGRPRRRLASDLRRLGCTQADALIAAFRAGSSPDYPCPLEAVYPLLPGGRPAGPAASAALSRAWRALQRRGLLIRHRRGRYTAAVELTPAGWREAERMIRDGGANLLFRRSPE